MGYDLAMHHLGDFNDLMLVGTLSGVEMGRALAGVPTRPGCVEAAMRMLTGEPRAGITARWIIFP